MYDEAYDAAGIAIIGGGIALIMCFIGLGAVGIFYALIT